MNLRTIEEYLTSLGEVTKETITGDNVILFKRNDKLFALLELTDPIKISLRCDPELASLLREKYETVMPGQKLNNKHWNTIVLTGQIDWPEIQGFIRLSYNLTGDQL
jgi:predicted DNA-binding protein (MmcQ/YjbR family)